MASFTIELYYPKSVNRDEALRRLKCLPDQRPDDDRADMGWTGSVHWSALSVDHAYTADRIKRFTGMEVGEFSIQLTVYNPEDEVMLQQWDRAVDLLEYGEDSIALYQLSDLLFIQKDGNLTLDSQSDYQSDYFREHVRRRRQAEVKPLGSLEELD